MVGGRPPSGGILDGEDGGAHIAPRREANPFAPPRLDSLYCYGVDFLSTKEVVELFGSGGHRPHSVEWIDDSSCVVVFDAEDAVRKAIDNFAVADEPRADDIWTVTRPLTIGQHEQQKSSRAARVCRLQIRVASEADRKDPGHSGHTDSVYYSHVKEEQALRRQRAELHHAKKRQRKSRIPAPEIAGPPGSALGTVAPAMAVIASTTQVSGDDASSSVGTAEVATAQTAAQPPRLGLKGLLDPLLFLRAPGGIEGVPTVTSASADAVEGDLRAALRKAEAEYATLPQLGVVATTLKQGGVADIPATAERGRKEIAPERRQGVASHQARGRKRTPGRGGDRCSARDGFTRDGAPGHQCRSRKRRPVSQEPRPVLDAAPPPRRPEALPEVEAFLKEHHVRCQRFTVQRSFRSIIYGQQKKNRSQGAACHAAAVPSGQKEPLPWEQYLLVNGHFTGTGQLMHTVALEADGRRVLAVVPHPMWIDMECLARALQKPVTSIRKHKLKEIERITGFPTFVCPPFGHRKDAQGRLPLLLVDSTVTELKKPLLFDCGSVGLRLHVSEFLRSTRAACIEGLARVGADTRQPLPPACADPQVAVAGCCTTGGVTVATLDDTDTAAVAPKPASVSMDTMEVAAAFCSEPGSASSVLGADTDKAAVVLEPASVSMDLMDERTSAMRAPLLKLDAMGTPESKARAEASTTPQAAVARTVTELHREKVGTEMGVEVTTVGEQAGA